MTQQALSALLGAVVIDFKRYLVNSSKEDQTLRNLRLKDLDRFEILETSNALVSVTVVRIHKERQFKSR
jgi:hypothetical protein